MVLYWIEGLSFDDEYFNLEFIENIFKVTTKIKWATESNKTGLRYPLQTSNISIGIISLKLDNRYIIVLNHLVQAFDCTKASDALISRSKAKSNLEMDGKLEHSEFQINENWNDCYYRG